MKTKLFLFLALSLPVQFSFAAPSAPISTTLLCSELAAQSIRSCQSEKPAESEAQKRCPVAFTGDTIRDAEEVEKFKVCAKTYADTLVNQCIQKIERVAGLCVEDYSYNFDSAEASRIVEESAGHDPMMAPAKRAARVSRIYHEAQQIMAQKALEDVTQAQDKITREKEAFNKKVDSFKAPVVVDNDEITPNDSARERAPADGKKEDSPWQSLANAIMGSQPAPSAATPAVPQAMPETQLPRYQSWSEGAAVAARRGGRESSGMPIARDVNPKLDDVSSPQEKSKAGQLEAKSSIVSGKVGIQSGSSLRKSQNTTSAGSKSAADSRVSEGYLSAASAGRGTVKLSFPGAQRLTVGQLRQKLIEKQNLRTPAQLRFEAGIGQAHGNMFNKIRFRYERLSSTLIP